MRSRGGAPVVTVSPDDTVSHLLDVLAQHRIGAAVVTADGRQVDGIISERDIVKSLQAHGARALEHPVSDIMTSDVHTCTPDMQVADIARMMTEHRIRHLPVLRNGALHSIVSIGDVVKYRIDQLQDERDQLVEYIHR